MKWLQVVLFAVIVLVTKAAAFTDAELVQRSLCEYNYHCKDYCYCEVPRATVPKMCFCHGLSSPEFGDGIPKLACRRSMYL